MKDSTYVPLVFLLHSISNCAVACATAGSGAAGEWVPADRLKFLAT